MPNRGLAASAAALLALACLTAAAAQAPADRPALRRPSPRAYRGRWALQAFERVLPQLAQRHGIWPERLRNLLAQERDVWVDEGGDVLFTCGFPAPPRQPAAAAAAGVEAAAPFPLENTFQLHSRPGAQRTVYLDFDGHTTSGTSWNFTFTSGAPIVSEPFDTDGNTTSFNAQELEAIQQCWQRVAEDYAPLNVDVTTQDPGVEALRRTTAADEVYGTRVVISPTSSFYPGVGGVAYVGVFNNLSSGDDLPCFVFSANVANTEKNIAEAASHEAGHTLGLSHDGTSNSGYYTGHGDWAPLMGVGYYRNITQWSQGEYAGANNTQEDFDVMAANGGSLAADDFGDTTASASTLSGTATGVISTRADLDFFRLNAGAGTLSVTAAPASHGANLDIRLTLYDGSGTVLTFADPAELSASVSRTVTAGTYYVSIDGVGAGSPLDTGYSDYGSLGTYTLTANTSAPTPSITVTAPDGGENWQIGSVQNLTWTSTNVSGNVKLEYSTDAGASWTAIAASTANDGKESWTVPNTPTTQARVRVSAVAGSPADTSNANFTISLAPDAYEPDDTANQAGTLGAGVAQDRSIHLAGNEDWAQFALSGVSNVDLQATGDTEMWLYGPNSSTSEVAYDAGSGTLARIRKSALAAGTYYVRVRERQNNATIAAYTLSLAVAVPGLTVTAPNGGETWLVGSAHNLTWASANVSGNVKLEYSTDGGSTWSVIQADTANDGTEAWTVPDTPTTRARLRVTAVDGSAADQSDANFTIAQPPSITVTSPNGGESWRILSSQTLTWTSTNVSGDVKLEYSTDSGASWTLIKAATANDGTEGWIVPDAPTAKARLRVSAVDGSAADTSNADFTLSVPGGDAYEPDDTPAAAGSISAGQTQTRSIHLPANEDWASFTLSGPSKVVLETSGTGSHDTMLYLYGPNDPALEVARDEDGGAGEYSRIVRSGTGVLAPGTYYVRAHEGGKDALIDAYNLSLTVQPVNLQVTSPNGGEVWLVASSQTITWSSTGVAGSVKLEYSPDGGATWSLIEANTPNDGAEAWTAPPAPTTRGRIRVTALDGSAADTSDADFTLALPASLTVTSPNGGENWPIGSSHVLTWSSTSVPGPVRLQYSTDGGASWTDITASTPNDGSEAWTVPATPTTRARIRVSAVDGSAVDTSDADFTLGVLADAYEADDSSGEARLLKPVETQSRSIHLAGNEDWAYFVLTGMSDVNLQATGDTELWLYGPNSLTTQVGYDGGTGSLSRIQQSALPAGTYYVRVRSRNGVLPAYSLSLQVTPCQITVVSPNGGQAWEVGSSQTVTWSSVGVTGPVKLEYSVNGGSTWTTLAASTPNDGSEPWTVPNTPTAQALFRVSAVDDPNCQDTSDSVFNLVPKPGDTYENDNTRDQAQPIAAGETQSHSLHQVGDADWVRFTLTAPRRVTLTTAGAAGGDTLLELYNSAGRRLTAHNDIAAPRNRYSRISNRRLGKGTYYVRVLHPRNNSTISAYTLNLQVRR